MTILQALRLTAPPSKSITHRALLLAALADVPCRVHRPLLGADCRSTLSVLTELGFWVRARPDGDVESEPTAPTAPRNPLDCGNSGTTLRLMIGQAALWPFATTLTGDDSLRQRPNGPLLAALKSLGVAVDADQGRAPVRIDGPLPAAASRREVALPGGLSSQYATSLLLALAQAPGPCKLELLPPVASRPYLDLTVTVAAAFGLSIKVSDGPAGGLLFEIAGGQRPRLPLHRSGRGHFSVEGDWSGAAFPLIAATLAGVPLLLAGLAAGSSQGDRAIVDLLRQFGVELTTTAAGELALSGATLRAAGDIHVGATPDLFPPLCALAACAPGVTRLHGSPGLRHKECDRIAAMAAGLQACGIVCRELADGLVVHGGQPQGASVRSEHDHRVHMAFAMLGLVSNGPMAVDHPDCIAISYPQFHDHLAAITAHARGADQP